MTKKSWGKTQIAKKIKQQPVPRGKGTARLRRASKEEAASVKPKGTLKGIFKKIDKHKEEK